MPGSAHRSAVQRLAERWGLDVQAPFQPGGSRLDDIIGLLLERCLPGTMLGTRPEAEQDLVVADLLPRLWRAPPAGHGFRPLEVMCDQWPDSFEEKAGAGSRSSDPSSTRSRMWAARPTTRSCISSTAPSGRTPTPELSSARIADLLELDRDRPLAWLFARCVQESLERPHLAGVARQIAPA